MRSLYLAAFVAALFLWLAPDASAQGWVQKAGWVSADGHTDSHVVTMEFRDDDGDGTPDRVRVRENAPGGLWGGWLTPTVNQDGTTDWKPYQPPIGPPSLEMLTTKPDGIMVDGEQKGAWAYMDPAGQGYGGTQGGAVPWFDPIKPEDWAKRPPSGGGGHWFHAVADVARKAMHAQSTSAEYDGDVIEGGDVDKSVVTITYTDENDGGSVLDKAQVTVNEEGGEESPEMTGTVISIPTMPVEIVFTPPPPPVGPPSPQTLVVRDMGVTVNGKRVWSWEYTGLDGTTYGGLGNGTPGNPVGVHPIPKRSDFMRGAAGMAAAARR